ncbi:hypothetical protein JHJ32_07335 [Parapedobacter sp. ISTM3]|uniref:hypothetical protein n=1 Tax=Parapedobacter sp. ISTM3 TaxID=2800130 RepID=UPI001905E36C|nr:hypothetical protein [Parapedobacter sp. ISTM3]MBK1439790.1 hypothetical protein [Parapedobacter sp. ISTM3]
MNVENFETQKNALEWRGFPEEVFEELKRKMEAGEEEFSLKCTKHMGDELLHLEPQFRKHSERDIYYFNRYLAVLTDKNGKELVRASIKRSWQIPIDEAYNMLKHGSKVAVYKEGIYNDEGQQFNACIAVNVDQELNEDGSLNINIYHESYYKKYPFDLDNALSRLPVQIKELVPENIGDIKAALISATPVEVTVVKDGEEVPGYLTINAKVGRVDVRDAKMKLLETPKKRQDVDVKQKAENAETQGQNASPGAGETETADDEKKKPWQNRQQNVKWNRDKQGKGMSV